MAKNPIRKIFGHLFLYLIIILGIFALQFRSQSIISRNFGQLRLTLSEVKNDSGEKQFKDNFYISYKGVSLFSNNETRIFVTNQNGEAKPLVFTGWKELSASSFELYFSENIVLLCGLTGANQDVLTLSYPAGSSFKYLEIPYKISDSYSLMNNTPKRAIISSKTQQLALTAPIIEETVVILTSAENTITYSNYEPCTEFFFETSEDYELAQKNIFEKNVQTIKDSLIAQFPLEIDNLTEQLVVSYITEMASQNKYKEALSAIPDSFTNGNHRTYLSSPYLNNLVAMDESLMRQQENMVFKLNYAIEKQSLDIFKADSLYDFLLTQNSQKVSELLRMPATLDSLEPSVAEATGIINLYISFERENTSHSETLLPYIKPCLEVIRKACVIENDALYIIEKEEKIPTLTTMSTAKTLIDYGNISSYSALVSTGYMLFNSQVQNTQSFETKRIAEIYAILEKTNTYYPHRKAIGTNKGNPIWIWTSAKEVIAKTDADETVTLQTSFPTGYTHYMILHNIEPFKSIEIYDMMFRTDPRFESYNSSGYVYDADTKTLYLKFRHKNYTEIVRLFYKEQTQPETMEENLNKTERNTTTTNVENSIVGLPNR